VPPVNVLDQIGAQLLRNALSKIRRMIHIKESKSDTHFNGRNSDKVAQ
jgi:hypothetical protein